MKFVTKHINVKLDTKTIRC